jgi:lipopolysaccharide transport system ATP-binding protein
MVACERLSKAYSRATAIGVKEWLVGRHRRAGRFARTWALKEVSFEVPRGASFGIVGANGSGKTTLLSVLLGVLVPDEGRVEVRGRVASLLELGAGFHPELTGYQNAALYASILGLRLREIRARLDAIADFSGLGEALELPLRTYSSGMITRLGISTIAHVDADLLLIDEVLAAGDLEFQEKCLAYLRTFRDRGGTLVIVSHDLVSVTAMCERGLCLDYGRVRVAGSMADVAAAYREFIHHRPVGAQALEKPA